MCRKNPTRIVSWRYRRPTRSFPILKEDGTTTKTLPVRKAVENVPVAPTIIGRRRQAPEPLIPEPISVMRDFPTFSDSFESLFDRFFRNFTGVGVPKAEKTEGLTLELILSPEEALKGGRITLKIPVLYSCPMCGGTGREWPFSCMHCGGEGRVESEEPVSLNIPSGVRNGTVYDIPLRGYGIRNFYLRLFIRIGDAG